VTAPAAADIAAMEQLWSLETVPDPGEPCGREECPNTALWTMTFMPCESRHVCGAYEFNACDPCKTAMMLMFDQDRSIPVFCAMCDGKNGHTHFHSFRRLR
jgi:hypothetical protein